MQRKRIPGVREGNIRAFTLVELLVVISIITTLVSIMLPSLGRAQKQAEQTHCLANQHQLMMGWMQYAMDHDDYLCDPNDESLDKILQPFVKSEDVFICKGIEGTTRRNGYGLSNTMGGKPRDGILPVRKLHKIRQTSNSLVLIDVEPRSQTWFWPILRSNEQWYWRSWSWPTHTSLQGLTTRHSRGCNQSFADGHGQMYRYHDDRTIDFIKGLIVDPNAASQDNEDLQLMVGMFTRQQHKLERN
ncbi:type II secretion system protein [Planctomycetota bacterium]